MIMSESNLATWKTVSWVFLPKRLNKRKGYKAVISLIIARRVKQQLQATACQNESERGYSSPEQINISLTVDSVFMIY